MSAFAVVVVARLSAPVFRAPVEWGYGQSLILEFWDKCIRNFIFAKIISDQRNSAFLSETTSLLLSEECFNLIVKLNHSLLAEYLPKLIGRFLRFGNLKMGEVWKLVSLRPILPIIIILSSTRYCKNSTHSFSAIHGNNATSSKCQSSRYYSTTWQCKGIIGNSSFLTRYHWNGRMPSLMHSPKPSTCSLSKKTSSC